MVLFAITLIALLIFIAIGLFRNILHQNSVAPIGILPSWMTVVAGALWAVMLYIIVLLAFGILPTFPSALAIAIGMVLSALALYFVPRWTANLNWDSYHTYSLIFGIMLGSMLAGFIGFVGSASMDLYFKIIANLLAVFLMIRFGKKVKQQDR